LPAGFYLRASKLLALPILAAMASPEADKRGVIVAQEQILAAGNFRQ